MFMSQEEILNVLAANPEKWFTNEELIKALPDTSEGTIIHSRVRLQKKQMVLYTYGVRRVFIHHKPQTPL